MELMFTKKGGRYVGAILRGGCHGWTSDDYAKAYARFTVAAGVRRPEFVTMLTLYPDQCRGGVYWLEGLSPRGGVFTLIQLPGVADADVQRVRTWLRANRDVYRVIRQKIDDTIDFEYHGRIYINAEGVYQPEGASHA